MAGFWDKIQLLLASPTQFFQSIKNEESIGPAFMAYLVVAALTTFIGSLIGMSLPMFMPSSMGLFAGLGVIFSIVSLLVIIAGSFVFAGFIHLFVMLFKGTGSYTESYKAVAYSTLPALVLGLIPFVGFFGSIYSTVLTVIGIAQLHNLSTGKAVLVILIPIFIVMSLALLLAALIFLGVFSPVI